MGEDPSRDDAVSTPAQLAGEYELGVEPRTLHRIWQADARCLGFLDDESVQLVVTSPPYGNLKEYPKSEGQLGNIPSYEDFLRQLDLVWEEVARVLVKGGRACVVVGDVCLSRRRAGRHHVLPLAADIQVRARRFGLDVLTPIIWLKVANISLEASRSSRFLGKPYLPGGVIKNDRETIILLRKPGGYRSPTPAMEDASRIAKDDYFSWFTPVWSDVTGASTRNHPAPFPIEIPYRLIRMYSFVGDTVVDPFAGTGTTMAAAALAGRHSVGIEVDPSYVEMSLDRLERFEVPISGPRRARKAGASTPETRLPLPL
jgi:site-specific DNA-methyltransferase (adenine-specific)